MIYEVYIHVCANKILNEQRKKKKKEKKKKRTGKTWPSTPTTLSSHANRERERQSHATVTVTAKVLWTLTQGTGRLIHSTLVSIPKPLNDSRS